MEPEPFVIMGMMLGSLLTLAVQFFNRRRKAKKEAAEHQTESTNDNRLLLAQQDRMYASMMRLEERIGVVERISTEREGSVGRLSKEIEELR